MHALLFLLDTVAALSSELAAWKVDAEASIAAFATFKAELAATCAVGEVVVGVTPAGVVVCSDAVSTQIRSAVRNLATDRSFAGLPWIPCHQIQTQPSA